MVWFLEGVCFLPTFLVIWSSGTFIINYVFALLRGDIDVIFPYISDTGARPPESCLFGLMANITAVAGLATMFARYKFVQRVTERRSGVLSCLNTAAVIAAIVSCAGMCIVATFQETAVRAIHDLGACLFFISGVVYINLQAVISYQTYPYGSSKCTYYFRFVLAFIALLGLFPTIICASLVKTTKMHWNKEDKDYTLHFVSAVSEWTVSFTFVFFFLTYLQEFKYFTLRVNAELLEFT